MGRRFAWRFWRHFVFAGKRIMDFVAAMNDNDIVPA
jgi:hypothetical protein